MRLVLLGDPVGHSLSPPIFRAAFAAAGVTGSSYEARRVDAAGLAAAMAEIQAGEIDGANVTMPHKRLAARGCSDLDRDAARAGAVNTLARRDGLVIGWNTDILALRDALAGMPDGPVLVLGAGAAAAAAIVAAGSREQIVAARRPEAARAVSAAAIVGEWGRPVEGAIVVNATPLGMRGEALPDRVLLAAFGLVDLAYGPTATPAVTAMRERGAPVVDGIDVLVAQAAASFTIWTGVTAPIEAMERAARG
jgi:shikimate dehydrogenase